MQEYGRRGVRWSVLGMEQWQPEPSLVLGGSGGSCSSAPQLESPSHGMLEHVLRGHIPAREQHLMGQEVRREHGPFPTCFPSISPAPGKC